MQATTYVAKYWVFIYEPHYDHNDLFFWISSLRTQSKNYKYLELEEINHFDDQRHLQNLIRFALVIISKFKTTTYEIDLCIGHPWKVE